MIMRYCPPYIFPWRCYVTVTENEIKHARIIEKFGSGGSMPLPHERWLRGQTRMEDLVKMGIDKECYGVYYGFRNADDQMLFYMTFEGQLGRN